MDRKKALRSLISLVLLAALITVLIVSQNHDPSNPHSTVDKQVWINGPKGHGYAVNNNQQPWKQCYTCHIKKGLGGESYCQACHEKSGAKVNIPQKP